MQELNFKTEGISIVIPNWNGKKLLERYLPSVVDAAKNSNERWEIITVDDGSTDGSDLFLKRNYSFVRLIRNHKHSGFSRVANLGFRSAKYGIVILLNNDVEVTRDFIPPLLRHFTDPKTFAVAARAYDFDRVTLTDGGRIVDFLRGFFRYRTYDVPDPSLPSRNYYPAFSASGGFSAFSRDKVLLLGGFDELFSPFSMEDTDLSYRAWKRGWNIHYEPKSIVYHQPSTTIRSRFRRFTIDTISKRNRLYFHWKNLSDADLLIQHFIFLFISIFFSLFERDFVFYSAFLMSIPGLPRILEKRKIERWNRKRKDHEVLKIISLWSENGGKIIHS
jgi:GT2 family glycosyltransferase